MTSYKQDIRLTKKKENIKIQLEKFKLRHLEIVKRFRNFRKDFLFDLGVPYLNFALFVHT